MCGAVCQVTNLSCGLGPRLLFAEVNFSILKRSRPMVAACAFLPPEASDLLAIFRSFRIVALAFNSLDAMARWWVHNYAHAKQNRRKGYTSLDGTANRAAKHSRKNGYYSEKRYKDECLHSINLSAETVAATFDAVLTPLCNSKAAAQEVSTPNRCGRGNLMSDKARKRLLHQPMPHNAGWHIRHRYAYLTFGGNDETSIWRACEDMAKRGNYLCRCLSCLLSGAAAAEWVLSSRHQAS